jgi:signal peptidase II
LKKYVVEYLRLFAIAGIVAFLDQWTKSWIHQNLLPGEVYQPELWLTSYARFVYVMNTGAVFGLFQRFGGVITIFYFVVGLGILIYIPRVPPQARLIRLSMGLYLGGAIGNLIDRLTYGYVTDFISLGILPVFNLADLSISLGAVLFVAGILAKEIAAT